MSSSWQLSSVNPISYILTNFYGFIIIVEIGGHPIGDINFILYISTKEKSYVINPYYITKIGIIATSRTSMTSKGYIIAS